MSGTLDLGDKFGIAQLPRMVLPYMRAFAALSVHLWDGFVSAAKNDPPVLARFSLQELLKSRQAEETVFDIDRFLGMFQPVI